jgi:Fe-S cluster assembly iron-binding protein IscA
MKIAVTGEALKEIRSIAKQQQIQHPTVVLNVIGGCCGVKAKVDVVDQPSDQFTIVGEVDGFPVAACPLVKRILETNRSPDDVHLQVRLLPLYSLSFYVHDAATNEPTG